VTDLAVDQKLQVFGVDDFRREAVPARRVGQTDRSRLFAKLWIAEVALIGFVDRLRDVRAERDPSAQELRVEPMLSAATFPKLEAGAVGGVRPSR
jgi:hypothetical protein